MVTLGVILTAALFGLLAIYAITVSLLRAFDVPLERDKDGHLVIVLRRKNAR
jgi:hypothetical protein